MPNPANILLIKKQKSQLQHLNLSNATHYVPASIEDASKLASDNQSAPGFEDNLIGKKCMLCQRVPILASNFVAPMDKER